MNNYLLYIFISLLPLFSCAQQEKSIVFSPKIGNENLKANESYTLDTIDFKVDQFRVYISHLTFYHKGKAIHANNNEYLIDLEDTTSYEIQILSLEIDSVSFYVGIDSLTNVNGIGEGVLDPVNGMYWSWNTGYINFKLTGKTNQNFEYHIGGYLPPYETIQIVNLPIKNNENELKIAIQLDIFARFSLLNEQILIPGKRATELASVFPLMFKQIIE